MHAHTIVHTCTLCAYTVRCKPAIPITVVKRAIIETWFK